MRAAERAGELWWRGQEEALTYKLDKMAPACLTSPLEVLARSSKITPQFREGRAWTMGDLRKFSFETAIYGVWKVCMEAAVAATESAERAEESINRLRGVVNDFRSVIKNDLSSMKAASERVQNEVLQMQEQYKRAQSMLTTPEFMQAIQNAERMAAALKAIQDLTETKISVAVFGGGKGQ